jgi:hypothetical protein
MRSARECRLMGHHLRACVPKPVVQWRDDIGGFSKRISMRGQRRATTRWLSPLADCRAVLDQSLVTSASLVLSTPTNDGRSSQTINSRRRLLTSPPLSRILGAVSFRQLARR